MATAEESLAKRGLRRAENDRVYDWLREVASNIRNFMKAPAMLLVFMNDNDVMAQVVHGGHFERFEHLIATLGRDVEVYVRRFQGIYAKHSQVRGSSTNADDMFRAINISQEYIELMASYEQVVVGNLEEALRILESVGVDVSNVRVASNSTVIYDLIKPQSAG